MLDIYSLYLRACLLRCGGLAVSGISRNPVQSAVTFSRQSSRAHGSPFDMTPPTPVGAHSARRAAPALLVRSMMRVYLWACVCMRVCMQWALMRVLVHVCFRQGPGQYDIARSRSAQHPAATLAGLHATGMQAALSLLSSWATSTAPRALLCVVLHCGPSAGRLESTSLSASQVTATLAPTSPHRPVTALSTEVRIVHNVGALSRAGCLHL